MGDPELQLSSCAVDEPLEVRRLFFNALRDSYLAVTLCVSVAKYG